MRTSFEFNTVRPQLYRSFKNRALLRSGGVGKVGLQTDDPKDCTQLVVLKIDNQLCESGLRRPHRAIGSLAGGVTISFIDFEV